jgi:hypothetical protein
MVDSTGAPPGSQSCPRCQGTHFTDQYDPTGPHAGRRVCADCGRFVAWLPAPWSRERAERFEFKFGAFAGWKVGDLARDHRGREHLRWLARYGHGNARTAARIVLGLDSQEGKA